MRKTNYILLALLLTFAAFVGCNGSGNVRSDETSSESPAPPSMDKEADLLLDYLNENGDYVNSREFPSIILASTLYEELGKKNILVIDIRDQEAFKNGHIEGARNVEFSELPSFFENEIKAFQYDKIVIACNHGQKSSYTTALLRLMGYGNVYSLRWGMSVWNRDIYDLNPWSGLVSDELTDQLEKSDNEKPEPDVFPSLNTGLTSGEEILNARMKTIFSEGFTPVFSGLTDIVENPGEYFIINYDRKDKYESGHLPGAVRYKPNATLGIPAEMATIPADRDVAVYCGTGHSSAFVVAYLRLFGYNAHTIAYGNNRFMHGKMIQEEDSLSWAAFTEDMIHDYPYVKGQ